MALRFLRVSLTRLSLPTFKGARLLSLRSGLQRFAKRDYDVILAPYPTTPIRAVPRAIARPPYASLSNPTPPTDTEGLDVPKLAPDEIQNLKLACSITKRALDMTAALIKPGAIADDIDRAVHEFIIANGAYPSPLGYLGFPKACCVSVNNVVCHGIPDMRPLKDGDIVNVDVTSYINGFHGDSSRTFLVGRVDEQGQKLVRVALECLMLAVQICKPDVPYNELGTAIERHAKSHKFTICKEFIGHGIGRTFHCPPQIFPYENPFPGKMEANTAFTIEPCINENGRHMRILNDGWTAVTVDNGRSAQFEHTVLITDTSYEILT